MPLLVLILSAHSSSGLVGPRVVVVVVVPARVVVVPGAGVVVVVPEGVVVVVELVGACVVVLVVIPPIYPTSTDKGEPETTGLGDTELI